MKGLKAAAIACCMGGLIASTGIASAQNTEEKGKEMTYTGCVAPGKDASTFMLTDVTASGGAPAAAGKKEAAPKVVTLSSTAVKIDPHSGHKVTVTGLTTMDKGEAKMTVSSLKMVSPTCP
jgi:hypothetical protein